MNKTAKVVPYAHMSMLFMLHQAEHEETIQHTLRCTKTVGEFGSYLGLSKDKIYKLEQGAMIHDAGKFSCRQTCYILPAHLVKTNLSW